jgi:predicted HD phosphohydrolase
MDKIFSARLDETVLAEMQNVVYQHHMTKKRFLEEAIHQYASTLKGPEEKDVWAQTCGAWKRKESAAAIVKQIRTKMRKNFRRHHLS